MVLLVVAVIGATVVILVNIIQARKESDPGGDYPGGFYQFDSVVDQSPEKWIDDAVLAVGGLARHEVSTRTERSITIRRSTIPVWAIVVAVLLFPLGLFALLVRKNDTVSIVTELPSDGGQTVVRLQGDFSSELARRLHPLLPAPA